MVRDSRPPTRRREPRCARHGAGARSRPHPPAETRHACRPTERSDTRRAVARTLRRVVAQAAGPRPRAPAPRHDLSAGRSPPTATTCAHSPTVERGHRRRQQRSHTNPLLGQRRLPRARAGPSNTIFGAKRLTSQGPRPSLMGGTASRPADRGVASGNHSTAVRPLTQHCRVLSNRFVPGCI